MRILITLLMLAVAAQATEIWIPNKNHTPDAAPAFPSGHAWVQVKNAESYMLLGSGALKIYLTNGQMIVTNHYIIEDDSDDDEVTYQSGNVVPESDVLTPEEVDAYLKGRK